MKGWRREGKEGWKRKGEGEDKIDTYTHTQPFYCSSGICPGPPR